MIVLCVNCKLKTELESGNSLYIYVHCNYSICKRLYIHMSAFPLGLPYHMLFLKDFYLASNFRQKGKMQKPKAEVQWERTVNL